MKLCYLITSCSYIDMEDDGYDSHVMSFRYRESSFTGAILIYHGNNTSEY